MTTSTHTHAKECPSIMYMSFGYCLFKQCSTAQCIGVSRHFKYFSVDILNKGNQSICKFVSISSYDLLKCVMPTLYRPSTPNNSNNS